MTRRASPSVLRIALAASVAGGAGCGAEVRCDDARLEPLAGHAAWAVVTSDFASTAITLLDGEGGLLTGGWIDSGTTAPGLATTLSGDVVLPTKPGPEDALTLIDRLGTDVITHISLPDGEVLGQTHTTLPTERGQTAYRANPQDLIHLDGRRVLVSRHEPNLDPDAPELDRGNDLVVIDLESGSIEERFDLGSLDVVVQRDGYGVPTFARPARMVQLDDRVLVGLARLSLDFGVAGPGAVAVVDLPSREVQAVALEGLTNCGEVVHVPGATARVAIACAGSPFGDEEARRASGAGLALLESRTTREPLVIHRWLAAQHADLPAASGQLVPLGPNVVVAVAMGDTEHGTRDRLVRVDMATGEVDVLLEATAAFVLGTGSYAPERHLLLVPDASRGMLRFEVGPDLQPRLRDVIDVSPCRRLGPREVRPLR